MAAVPEPDEDDEEELVAGVEADADVAPEILNQARVAEPEPTNVAYSLWVPLAPERPMVWVLQPPCP